LGITFWNAANHSETMNQLYNLIYPVYTLI
jgi:hypothetical protein